MDKRLKDYYDGLFSRRKSQKSRSGSLSTGKMNLCPTPCGSCSTGKKSATATVAQIPDFVVRWEYENRSSVTQQLSTGFSSTATRTSSFSNTYGVSVSVTSSFSVNVPVTSANLTISMNSSYSHTWGKSETQSDTRNYNFPISVPPYCRIVAEAIVARYQLNVGYTTYLRSVNTGKEIRLEGRWSGIDCAEIKAKCTEYELDSNNITKIKTFNGVPHEAVV